MPKSTYWADAYLEKRRRADEAMRVIRPGQRVFIGSACGQPQALVQALFESAGKLSGREVVRLMSRETAALTALALFNAYQKTVGLEMINLASTTTVIGLFLGALMPFIIAAMTMKGVGRAANKMVLEIRRQFREIAGIMEGKAEPDTGKCIDIVTKAALREMLLPGILAVAAPLAGVVALAAHRDQRQLAVADPHGEGIAHVVRVGQALDGQVRDYRDLLDGHDAVVLLSQFQVGLESVEELLHLQLELIQRQIGDDLHPLPCVALSGQVEVITAAVCQTGELGLELPTQRVGPGRAIEREEIEVAADPLGGDVLDVVELRVFRRRLGSVRAGG